MSQASNLAGFVTSISPINDLNVGIVTASNFIGDLTGTASTATAAATASYSVTAGVSTVAQGLTGTPDLNVGIVTATSFSGDGSGLSGVGPSQQAVTSSSPTTTIDLSLGNVIYFTHNVDTTVAFANTSTTQEVTFIRTKDDSGTPRSITWPAGIIWPIVGYPPALLNSFNANDSQTFNLVTRDGGSTWYGWEEQRYAGDNTYLFAIGNNNDGPLGQSNQTYYSSPVQIPGTTWSSVAGGAANVLATRSDGTLWGFGNNSQGQLGQNSRTQYSSPRQIPGTTWSSVSTDLQSLATKTDGTLWVWGNNTTGELGLNDIIRRSSPVQIPGTTWSSVSSGSGRSFAIKTDGTLWGWGNNDFKELGQSDAIHESSPVQIPGTTWSSIEAGNEHSLALKTDGTLWAWGRNQSGELGQNDRTNYSSPRQIPGTQWSYIDAISDVSLATKTDGTLWAWGAGSGGRLGQNDTTSYSSPTQIPGTTWTFISSGSNTGHYLANKTDGTLWSWGYNQSGQLGQNDRISRSSPTQIPGTYWSGQIYCGSSHTFVFSRSSL